MKEDQYSKSPERKQPGDKDKPKRSAKKGTSNANERTQPTDTQGADEGNLQRRCQVLEEHLTQERLAKAQALDREKKKDAKIVKLEEEASRANAKVEEERRRAEEASERERKAKHEHDAMKARVDNHDALVKQVQEEAQKETEAIRKYLSEETAAKEKAEKTLQNFAAERNAELQRLNAEVERLKGEKVAAAGSNGQEAKTIRAEMQEQLDVERKRWAGWKEKQKEVTRCIVENLKTDAQRALKRLEEVEKENKKLRAKNDENDELATMEQKLTAYSSVLDVKLEKAEASNKALVKEKEELVEKVRATEHQVTQKEEALAEMKSALAKLEGELARRNEELEEARAQSASEKDKLVAQYFILEATRSALMEERASLASELESAKADMELAKANAEKGRLAVPFEIELLKEEVAVLVKQNESLKQSEKDLGAAKQELESEVSNLKVAATAVAAKLDDLSRRDVDAHKQIASLTEAKDKLEGDNQHLNATVLELNLEKKKLSAQLKALMEEKQVVVEQGTRHAEMKEALQAEKEQLGTELQQLLERMEGQKMRTKKKSGLKAEPADALKGLAAKVDDIHEKLVDLEHRSELLTQAEEEREVAVQASAQKEAEIGKLRAQVLQLEARAVEAEARVAELEAALKAAQMELTQIQGFSKEKDEELKRLLEKVQAAAANEQEHEALRQKVAAQMAALLQAESQGRESEAQARRAEEAARRQDEEMAQMETTLQEKDSNVAHLRDQLSEKDAQLEGLKQQLHAEKEHSEELTSQLESAKDHLLRKDRSISQGEEARERFNKMVKQSLDEASKQSSAAATRESELRTKIKELESEREELAKQLRSEADALVRELVEKLAAAEAESAQKLSESKAEWARKVSDITAEKLAAEKELTAVRDELQLAKQTLADQKEQWEREKSEHAERQVAELQKSARESAHALEQVEKEMEENGGAIQQLREGITRRDVEIKDLGRELAEVKESLQATGKELEAQRAQHKEAREELARKDRELDELDKIQATLAKHKEEASGLFGRPKDVAARAEVDEETRRRREELKVLERVVQSKDAAPSRVRARRESERRGEANGAVEGDAQNGERAGGKPKGRVSFLGRKEAGPRASEENEGPTQERFEVDGDIERELQEQLRQKEEALAAEAAHRQRIEEEVASTASLLALRTAEASRLGQVRKQLEGHVAGLEVQIRRLQEELAKHSTLVSDVRTDANSQGASLTVDTKEDMQESGKEKDRSSLDLEDEKEKQGGRELTRTLSLGSRAGLERFHFVDRMTEKDKSLEGLQEEVESLQKQLEQERKQAESVRGELSAKLAVKEREVSERMQALWNAEQQLEDEEGDKRRLLSQMDVQKSQIEHLQQQLYGKKKSLEKLLPRMADMEKEIVQLRASPGHSPRKTSVGDDSPDAAPVTPTGERKPSPKLPLTISVNDLDRLHKEAEQTDLSSKFEHAGALDRKDSEEEILAMFNKGKTLQAELEASRKERAELVEQVKSLQDELDQRQAEVERLQEKVEQRKTSADTVDDLKASRATKQTLETDARRLQKDLEAVERSGRERESALEKSVKELKQQVDEKEKLLVESDTKFEELRGQIAKGQGRLRTLEDQAERLQAKVSDKEDYVEKLEREIAGQANMLVRMQDDLTLKEQQLTEWEGLVEAHGKEIAAMKKRDVLQTTVSEEKEKERVPRGDLQAQLEEALSARAHLGAELSAERQEWERRLVQLRRERESLEKQVTEERRVKTEALKGLQGKLRRVHFELEALRKEKEDLLGRVQGLSRTVRETEERILAAVEEKMGEECSSSVASPPKLGWREKVSGKSEVRSLVKESPQHEGAGPASPVVAAPERIPDVGSLKEPHKEQGEKKHTDGCDDAQLSKREAESTDIAELFQTRRRINMAGKRRLDSMSRIRSDSREALKSVTKEEERDQGRLALIVACTLGVTTILYVVGGRLGFL